MVKFKKFLKLSPIFLPLVVFLSCSETISQAETLLVSKDDKDSPYVIIDENTKTFTLDLSASRLEKIEKSAFFSLKSRFYQKVNSQIDVKKNTDQEKDKKTEPEKINFYTLKKVIFPESLLEIDDYAFYVDSANLDQNEKIQELDFSKAMKLRRIGSFAFQGNNIKTLVLPPSITSIGKQAFAKNSLETVDFSQATKLETIETGAFFDNKITELDLSKNLILAEIFPGSFETNQINQVKFNPNSKPLIIRKSAFKNNVISVDSKLLDLPKNSRLENIFS